MKKYLCVVSILAGGLAHAANVAVDASLNRDRLVLGEQLLLTVTVSGSASAAPQLAPIADVEMYGSGRSQSMSIINGSVTMNAVYTYVLSPRRAGQFTIPPIQVDGAAPTAPISFEAVEAGAAASRPPANSPNSAPDSVARTGTPDLLVTAELDQHVVYVNQQATLIVRFLAAVPLLSQPRYEPPQLNGVLVEPLGSESQGRAVYRGRQYNYSEIRYALFPIQAGRVAIGPATVTAQIPRRSGNPGDDFFDRFFNATAPEERRLQSDSLSLQVSALPTGKPADFSGIVGSASLSASVDRTSVKVGEAINLTLSVKGYGNIKSALEPPRPAISALRFFDSDSSFAPAPEKGKIGGTKSFRSVIVPRVSGTVEIPAFSVSYFDPSSKSYQTARSSPLHLSIMPADPGATLPSTSNTFTAPGVTAVSSDISYLKTDMDSGLFGGLAAFGSLGPWHVVPFIALALVGALEWRRRIRESNPIFLRRREAAAKAAQLIKTARSLPENALAQTAPLLAEALARYFSDKLDIPAAGITTKSLLERLRLAKRPPSEKSLESLRILWEELDLRRFAPIAAAQADCARLIAQTESLLNTVEREFRP